MCHDLCVLEDEREPLAARRVFPCVDEPDAKVPWTLTLEVPAALVAASNAPIASEEARGATRVVRFAATPPLPSYLVAFAVGPFDVVDAGATRGGVPMRILALAGRRADAAFAAEVTPVLVAGLEDWFGSAYPYAKLDAVAIPTTVGFERCDTEVEPSTVELDDQARLGIPAVDPSLLLG